MMLAAACDSLEPALSSPPALCCLQLSQERCVQSAGGSVEMTVFSTLPVGLSVHEGELMRVQASVGSAHPHPTLMLPGGDEVEGSVVMCQQRSYARRLTFWLSSKDIEDLRPDDACSSCC